MLLTISTEHKPSSDLGFLLHKHPERFQSFALSFGPAHVFYREVTAGRCTVCLLLEVDPVAMVRGRGRDQNFLLGQYVNDGPYVASSFLSVAIAQVFGTAMGGRCKDRPELVSTPIPLTARLDVLPVRAGHPPRPSTAAPVVDEATSPNVVDEAMSPKPVQSHHTATHFPHNMDKNVPSNSRTLMTRTREKHRTARRGHKMLSNCVPTAFRYQWSNILDLAKRSRLTREK